MKTSTSQGDHALLVTINNTTQRFDGPAVITRQSKVWFIIGQRRNLSMGPTSVHRSYNRGYMERRFEDNRLIDLCDDMDLDIYDLSDDEELMVKMEMSLRYG